MEKFEDKENRFQCVDIKFNLLSSGGKIMAKKKRVNKKNNSFISVGSPHHHQISISAIRVLSFFTLL